MTGSGPGLLLHPFFERAAGRRPEGVAVEVPPGSGRKERIRVTYAELVRQSDALARRLQPCVAGECVVAILLPRTSALLYAAQLAVLKAGAAHTCIDPAFPDEQVRYILDDCAAVALLTDAGGRARIGANLPGTVRVIDAGEAVASSHEPAIPTLPPPWLSPSSLAYVIYTSGTTGRPKGVLIEHRGIANLVGGDREEFQLSPGERVGQSSSASYDSSVEETWLALAAGATLVVMDDDTVRLGPDLIAWLRRERITVFCPPPTLLRATGCNDPQTALPDLKLLYVGGEALPQDVADRWAPGRRLVNGYGPTEGTVTALRGDVKAGEPITIGRPVPGVSACVLDEALQEVAGGGEGELCLGGIGLARGYWRRPELTAEKFIDHPSLGRLYRPATGCIATRRATIASTGGSTRRLSSAATASSWKGSRRAWPVAPACGRQPAACSRTGEPRCSSRSSCPRIPRPRPTSAPSSPRWRPDFPATWCPRVSAFWRNCPPRWAAS
jgi:amino acid adenylation domain-containing protein